jgi:hypothetical protein
MKMIKKARECLSPEEFKQFMKMMKKHNREVKEERRHQELCRAIKASGFWG